MKSLADAPNAYVTPYIASTQRLYNAYNFADSARFLPLLRAFACVPHAPYGVGNERTDGGGNNHVGRIVQAEQQSRTGDRHDKRDSADNRPAKEHSSSVCALVIFAVGEATAREITHDENHHDRYDHRGCSMSAGTACRSSIMISGATQKPRMCPVSGYATSMMWSI